MTIESLAAHIALLKSIFRQIENARLEYHDVPDTTEAQWYEPWDAILNWLRIRTDRLFWEDLVEVRLRIGCLAVRIEC